MAVPTPPWRRPARSVPDRPPLTQRRIVDQALVLLAKEGLDAVSMRRVAQALGTGPASLYAHLRNKEELYQLMLDQLIGEVTVPKPDPRRWREQLKELMRSLARVMTDHPGTAALAIATTGPDRTQRATHHGGDVGHPASGRTLQPGDGVRWRPHRHPHLGISP